ncbi:Kelch repeat-containing protein [Terriglobus albidus]|uniref:Kelch repeat-containing protein n=1 Tax=Terriglobus albidus TaxID=1592106 RepID=UPI0021DF94D9|nr:kelch repeat-containing protein [Terriglobus albidus]
MIRKTIASCIAALIFSQVLGCGGRGSQNTPVPAISVTLSPASATLFLRGTQTFTASVTGASDQRVVFEVTGGGSTTTSGVYTAPDRPGDYKIRAWSVADETKYAQASIHVEGYRERISDIGTTNDGYDRHTANLVPDGRVLIAGGYGSRGLHTRADIYVPGQVGVIAGPDLVVPRQAHASVDLSDGRILLTGGFAVSTSANFYDPVFKSSEIYDPVSNRFIAGPEMQWARREHTMTRLTDGRVLVVGGISLHGHGFSANPQAEIYSPSTNRFELAGRNIDPRWMHTATRLPDGRVLVAGGRPNNCIVVCSVDGLKSAEIFDPSTGQWSATGSMNISRYGHSAALMADGRVLILGGETTETVGAGDQVLDVEIYDPATGKFTLAGRLIDGRSFHALTELHDGRYLLAGGNKLSNTPLYTTEIYDPEKGKSTPGPEMRDFRVRARSVKLVSGKVLVIGGHNSGQPVAPLDLFE